MCDPTSSYATSGIALRVSGALKPHHHDKVETPSVGYVYTIFPKNSFFGSNVERGGIHTIIIIIIIIIIRK
jgi:hypothetical protein